MPSLSIANPPASGEPFNDDRDSCDDDTRAWQCIREAIRDPEGGGGMQIPPEITWDFDGTQDHGSIALDLISRAHLRMDPPVLVGLHDGEDRVGERRGGQLEGQAEAPRERVEQADLDAREAVAIHPEIEDPARWGAAGFRAKP